MSTTSSSPAPFILFAEKLHRDDDRPWREQVIPQLREGKVQWVTHPGAQYDPEVILNTLRVSDGKVGDVGYINPSNNTFRVLFNTLDPVETGCPFHCRSISNFDNEERTTHKLVIDFSKLFSSRRSAPPPAQILPDPYAAVDEEIVDGRLTQRVLNLSSATRENWSEAYADKIVGSYSDVTRDGLYIVTESIARSPPQPATQQTMTVPMHVYTKNLPAHMR